MSCYIDTSALAKWYLPEEGAEEFERFLLSLPQNAAITSSLSLTEMSSLLARRRRMGDFDHEHEKRIWQTFMEDVSSHSLVVVSLTEEHFLKAAELIRKVKAPLRALDALHLTAALISQVSELASGDKILLEAAAEVGLAVRRF